MISSMTRKSIDNFDLKQVKAGEKASFELVFDREVKEGFIPVNVIKGQKEGKTLLVLGGVHGDEYEGIQTIIQVFRDLSVTDITGTLVMIPVVNVSSYINGTRTTGVDGENLARAFPGDSNGNFTSRLAWHLHETFIRNADFLLDLHSGGTHYAMPALVGYYYDSNSQISQISKAAAEAFGMKVIWGHEQVGPGRTISSALSLNVPWLYTEGYGGKRIKREEQKQYEIGVYRLLNYLSLLTVPNKWVNEPKEEIEFRLLGDGNLDKAAFAEKDGFFIPSVNLLDEVKTNDRVGILYDLFGNKLQWIMAEKPGVVVMLRETPFTNKGDGLYALAEIEN
ncbi:succinylglutamate desuccinylase/aspartoacylase family protein [Bacillus sp. 1P02SD]|uniref:succinylglutamate desuccinylase/aspartoacylase family protein n=1 Tax=Bacillus sp. 1P02SD TaxID=3132264 RepID=UPI00399F2827